MQYTKATLADIPAMQQLVQPYVSDGIILVRTPDEMATNIRSYTLAKKEGVLVGFLALHIHNPQLGEIRSMAVSLKHQGEGIGSGLIRAALNEGQHIGLAEVLVLTYKWEFFEKFGFIQIPKESLPDHKIWADCIKCTHFPVCNEISLIKTLAS